MRLFRNASKQDEQFLEYQYEFKSRPEGTIEELGTTVNEIFDELGMFLRVEAFVSLHDDLDMALELKDHEAFERIVTEWNQENCRLQQLERTLRSFRASTKEPLVNVFQTVSELYLTQMPYYLHYDSLAYLDFVDGKKQICSGMRKWRPNPWMRQLTRIIHEPELGWGTHPPLRAHKR